jgi:hypothetical protein
MPRLLKRIEVNVTSIRGCSSIGRAL